MVNERILHLAGVLCEDDKQAQAIAVIKFIKDRQMETADDGVSFSMNDRDNFKKQFSFGRLNKIVPGPSSRMRYTDLFNAALGNVSIMQRVSNDNGDFVKGDKTILPKGKGKKVEDFAKAAGIKI